MLGEIIQRMINGERKDWGKGGLKRRYLCYLSLILPVFWLIFYDVIDIKKFLSLSFFFVELLFRSKKINLNR